MNERAFDQLVGEHRVLVGTHARVQARCSELIARQNAEIEALQAELMCLRAEVIRRDTQIAFLRQDQAELERTIPGLQTRIKLARKVSALMERIQDLMRDRYAHPIRPDEDRPLNLAQTTMLSRLDDRSVLCLGRDEPAARFTMRLVEMAGGRFTHDRADDTEDLARIEQSMRAADLVICQAGCISQNAYWRVRDHCKRTGKPCFLVERPEAVLPEPR